MKLAEWARQQNIAYITAYRWFRNNTLPVPAIQTATGTILVTPATVAQTKPAENRKIVIYCRVSSDQKKDDLQRQAERCESYCLAKGYSIHNVYKETASGMNDNRKLLWKAIEDKPDILVVEHRDRLTRFGFNYLDRLLNKLGCTIEVVKPDPNEEQELVKDMIAVVTSFCCRLYGARRGTQKAAKIKEAALDS